MGNPKDHRIHWLSIRNFKRFESLELELLDFNLLVGPNNSGKSTLLQACTLFDFCYRSSLDKQNGSLRFANRTFGADEFSAVPVADPLDLWHDRRALGKEAVPLHVGVKLRSGQQYAFDVVLRFNRFSVEAARENSSPLDPTQFGISFIPGYTGFWPREERRTPAVLRSMRAEGQHGGIVRNLLYDLKQSEARWQQFRQVMVEIFPQIDLKDPEFDNQVDRYIRSSYAESSSTSSEARKRQKTPTFDLFSAGSGFHQFVQIFASIYSETYSTVLLDEPDAHLFSRLQSRLHALLGKLVDDGLQVIAASHSPELIAAADPRSIISFANGTPRRLQVRAEAVGTARSLDALENIGLLLVDAYGKILIVEDSSDEDYMRWWIERLATPEQWRRLQPRLIFLHAHRRPKPAEINGMLDSIESVFKANRGLKTRALVFADRDYLLDDELEQERKKLEGKDFNRQEWVVWQRAEIENYLLDEDALFASLTGEIPATPGPKRAELAALVEDAIESSKDAARLRLVDAHARFSRDSRLNWAASTVTEKAEAFLSSVWRGATRLDWCDAKEHVLPSVRRSLQERWHLGISERQVCRSIPEASIPSDLNGAVARVLAFLLDD